VVPFAWSSPFFAGESSGSGHVLLMTYVREVLVTTAAIVWFLALGLGAVGVAYTAVYGG
jgi:hypothetical protein